MFTPCNNRHSRLPFIDINQHPQIILEKIKLAKPNYLSYFLYIYAPILILSLPILLKYGLYQEVVEPKLINNWIKKIFPMQSGKETYGATECIYMTSVVKKLILSLLK